MVGRLRDETGAIDLVWFTGIHWLQKKLEVGKEYVVFGKINAFNRQLNIPHPEIEPASVENTKLASTFAPVYPSTEKLNNKGLDSKSRRRIMKTLLEKVTPDDLSENLSVDIIQKLKLCSHYEAMLSIHFPPNEDKLKQAENRLKV